MGKTALAASTWTSPTPGTLLLLRPSRRLVPHVLQRYLGGRQVAEGSDLVEDAVKLAIVKRLAARVTRADLDVDFVQHRERLDQQVRQHSGHPACLGCGEEDDQTLMQVRPGGHTRAMGLKLLYLCPQLVLVLGLAPLGALPGLRGRPLNALDVETPTSACLENLLDAGLVDLRLDVAGMAHVPWLEADDERIVFYRQRLRGGSGLPEGTVDRAPPYRLVNLLPQCLKVKTVGHR